MTYLLLQGGESSPRSARRRRPRCACPGSRAGVQYSVAVVVNPARHRDRSERIGPKDVPPGDREVAADHASRPSFQETSAYRGNLVRHRDDAAGHEDPQRDLRPHPELAAAVRELAIVPATGPTSQLGQRSVVRHRPHEAQQPRREPARCIVGLSQNARTVTDPPLYGDGTTSSGVRSHRDDRRARASPRATATSSPRGAPTRRPPTPRSIVRYTGGDPQFLHLRAELEHPRHERRRPDHCGDRVQRPHRHQPQRRHARSTSHASGTAACSPCRSRCASSAARYNFHFAVNGSAPEPIDPGRIVVQRVVHEPAPRPRPRSSSTTTATTTRACSTTSTGPTACRRH